MFVLHVVSVLVQVPSSALDEFYLPRKRWHMQEGDVDNGDEGDADDGVEELHVLPWLQCWRQWIAL